MLYYLRFRGHTTFTTFRMAYMSHTRIADRLDGVKVRINNACLLNKTANNNTEKVKLVAVSKTKTPEMIIEAYHCGQREFGENYISELHEKSHFQSIVENCPEIKWHFIGGIQRKAINKLLDVRNLNVVETISSQKIAKAMNDSILRRFPKLSLKVMIQVNTSGEESKGGCVPGNDLLELADYIKNQCSNLELVGLMTIGKFGHDLEQGPNPDFLALIDCRSSLISNRQLCIDHLELSMGMSGDFEHAIELGSNSVRVGSAIFGERDYS